MYAITCLSQQSQSFITQIVSAGRSRGKIPAIALARMISSEFTIPTSPVEDPDQEYRNLFQIGATKIVSTVNEMVPVDTTMVMEMCRSFYKLRYRSAHPEQYVYSFREGNAISDFFEISRAFSDDTLTVIANEGKDLAFYANGFRRVLSEIREANKGKDYTSDDVHG